MTTAHSLSLGPLSLLADQHGPLLTITIHAPSDSAPVGKMTLTVPEWTALVAMVDSLAVADRRHAEDRAEIERLRGLLAKEHACHSARSHSDTIGMGAGYMRCEDSRCLATIDAPLVASSAWTVDARGWWFCPMHKEHTR